MVGSLMCAALLALGLAQQEDLGAKLAPFLNRAQAHLDGERYREAASELEQAIRIHPQIQGAYYQLGLARFHLNQLPAAEQAFTRELEFQPPDPYSLYYLGRIRLAANQRAQAIGWFEQSLKAGEVLDVRQRLASSYLAAGQALKAAAALEPAVRARPEDSALHYLLGRAYQQSGKLAEARREFDLSTRWKEKLQAEMTAVTRLRTAVQSERQGDVDQAAADLARSNDADVLATAGNVLGQGGYHAHALMMLEKAAGIQPNLPEAHYNIARAHAALGAPERALESLKRAVEQKPEFYEAQALLGTLLVQKGDHDQAIRHLRAATNLQATNPKLMTMLGLEYFHQRYYAEAIKTLQIAIELEPASPDPRFLLIQAHYRNQDYERALQAAIQTRTKFPELALSHFHVGAQLNNLNRPQEARQSLEAALAKNENLIEARVMLGDVLFKMGKSEESMVAYEAALAADGRQMDAYGGLGKALVQLKRYPEAVKLMERAVEVDASTPAPHLHLSQAYRALGRMDDAKREAAEFTRLNLERAKARDKDVERKYVE